jgi:hypothetical protein
MIPRTGTYWRVSASVCGFGIRVSVAGKARCRPCDNGHMADWIKGKRKQYEAQKAAELTGAKLQLHKAEILKQKARGVLDAITAAVARDVQEYQDEFTGIKEKEVTFTRKPSGGFSLERNYYPAASVECFLDPSGDTIVTRSMFKVDANAPGREIKKVIRLRVDNNDDIFMESSNRNLSTMEEVSRFLIEDALD